MVNFNDTGLHLLYSCVTGTKWTSPYLNNPPTSLERRASENKQNVPPAISHHQSAFSLQSIIQPQPSAVCHQPSVISHQPSAFSHQSPAISDQPLAISFQPSVSHPASPICRHSLASNHPSAISHQPSAFSDQAPAFSSTLNHSGPFLFSKGFQIWISVRLDPIK